MDNGYFIVEFKHRHAKPERTFTQRALLIHDTWHKWAMPIWNGLNCRTTNGKYADKPYIRNNKCFRIYLRKGVELRMTKPEFMQFCYDNKNTIESMIASAKGERRLRPSIDRIDSSGHYSIDNIRIVTVHDNVSKPRK